MDIAVQSFKIIGARGQSYQEIRGDGDTRLQMSQESDVVNVGGLMVEGDPIYTIKGTCNKVPVDLQVKPEDQVADAGGFKVQTGTIYHVSGRAGALNVKGDIESGHEVTDFGGLKVETDQWNVFMPQGEGQPQIKVGSVSEVSKAGGINIETGRYDVVGGKDAAGEVSGKLDGYDGKAAFKIAGTMAPETMALVVALQPFLKV